MKQTKNSCVCVKHTTTCVTPKGACTRYAISIRNFGGYPSHCTVSLHFMLLAPQPALAANLFCLLPSKRRHMVSCGIIYHWLHRTPPKNVFKSKKVARLGKLHKRNTSSSQTVLIWLFDAPPVDAVSHSCPASSTQPSALTVHPGKAGPGSPSRILENKKCILLLFPHLISVSFMKHQSC